MLSNRTVWPALCIPGQQPVWTSFAVIHSDTVRIDAGEGTVICRAACNMDLVIVASVARPAIPSGDISCISIKHTSSRCT